MYLLRLLDVIFVLCSAPTVHSSSSSSKKYKNNNNEEDTFNDVDRRWNSLMDYCRGSWKGHIGWYDAVVHNVTTTTSTYNTKKRLVLVPRSDNFKNEMLLSFQPDYDDDEDEVDDKDMTASWIVHDAMGKGVRQEVTLYKHPSSKEEETRTSPHQTFYCFDDHGILGRSGSFFKKLPVIEHGFWDKEEDDGSRRTIVLSYNSKNKELSKICFVHQRKLLRPRRNIFTSKLPRHQNPTSLDEFRTSWPRYVNHVQTETFNVSKNKYIRDRGVRVSVQNDDDSALTRLLGTSTSLPPPPPPPPVVRKKYDNVYYEDDEDTNTLRIALPNGVVLACPWSFMDSSKKFDIIMGYRRKNGQIHIAEWTYAAHSSLLSKVKASIYSKIQ